MDGKQVLAKAVNDIASKIYSALKDNPELLEKARQAVKAEDPIKAMYHSGFLKDLSDKAKGLVNGERFLNSMHVNDEIDKSLYERLYGLNDDFYHLHTREYFRHLTGKEPGFKFDSIINKDKEKIN